MAQQRKTPRVEIMFVTPEMAERWLRDGNTDNRILSERQVDRIARDIRADSYPLTHEAIAFDVNGKLIDGQHRLAAIVLSGKGVWIGVWFDLDPEVRMFIDQGRVRSFGDVAKFRFGEQVNRRSGAVARTMMDPMRKCNHSRYDQVQFYALHRENIDTAIEMFRGGSSDICVSYVVSVIARALYTVDRMTLTRFVEVLKDPVGNNARPVERSAVMLREYLIRTSELGRDRRHLYRRAQYLLSAFIARNHKPSSKAVAEAEVFPIPGDANYRKLKKSA